MKFIRYYLIEFFHFMKFYVLKKGMCTQFTKYTLKISYFSHYTIKQHFYNKIFQMHVLYFSNSQQLEQHI